jgi:hypothetical protein
MTTAKSKLLDRVRGFTRTLHCSRRTEDSYCEWIRRVSAIALRHHSFNGGLVE